MNKNPIKSKTINGALVVIVVAILSMFGIGETEAPKTYDALGKDNKGQVEQGKELATLLGAGFAIYGRVNVKKGKDDE